jgi:hypothetical protein
MTRITFGDGLDLNTNERVDTLGKSVPPSFASLILKKRKIIASQDCEPKQRHDIKASLGSCETATKSGLREL